MFVKIEVNLNFVDMAAVRVSESNLHGAAGIIGNDDDGPLKPLNMLVGNWLGPQASAISATGLNTLEYTMNFVWRYTHHTSILLAVNLNQSLHS